jgi:hypothetical protein
MSDEPRLEIYRQIRTAQEKYTYFMLAAAGACIAFAVTKTQEAVLAWHHLLLAGSVLCWGAASSRALANFSTYQKRFMPMRVCSRSKPEKTQSSEAIYISVPSTAKSCAKSLTKYRIEAPAGTISSFYFSSSALFCFSLGTFRKYTCGAESSLSDERRPCQHYRILRRQGLRS